MKTYEQMTNDVMEKVKRKRARRRGIATRIVSLSLAVVVSAGAILTAKLTRKDDPVKSGIPSSVSSELSVRKSYDEIYDLVRKSTLGGTDVRTIFEKSAEYLSDGIVYGSKGTVVVPNDINYTAQPIDIAPSGLEVTGDRPTSDASDDYTKTNVQVEGIDEADCVKTDGKYIYAVGGGSVSIIRADNGQMETVSTVSFIDENGAAVGTDGAAAGTDDAFYAFASPDIYITENRLIVVASLREKLEQSELPRENIYGDFIPLYGGRIHEHYYAAVYDISDRTAPSLVGTASISGGGISSRMIGGRLYLVASDHYYGDFDREDPATFVPSFCNKGSKELVPVDRIYCGGEENGCRYLNVLELDTSDASVTSTLSLLGYSGGIMYQNADNIYVAKQDYDWKYDEKTEGDVTTEIEKSSSTSVIAKISVGGGLALAGSARVDGYIHNSFSMDEYDGHLRVVTSVNDYEMIYKWRENKSVVDTDEFDTDEFDTDEPDADEYDTDEFDADESDADESDADEFDTDEFDADEFDTDEFDTDEYDTDEYDTDEFDADEFDTDEPDTDLSDETWEDVVIYPDGAGNDREMIDSSYVSRESNALFILDAGMNIVGRLENLAPDERIYSCRFEGSDGYFVTYRETDPLFHVDLSDPTAPRVIDELKLPGHSDYLQRFGEYLLGFGQNDEGELKISMFSEDENGAMTEVAVIDVTGAQYSEALYDHHAILADAGRGVICFAAESWTGQFHGTRYYVVSWDGEKFSFTLRLTLGSEWDQGVRGFFIGDVLYIYSPDEDCVKSYDLSTAQLIDTEKLEHFDFNMDTFYVYNMK